MQQQQAYINATIDIRI
ncbi:TPA: DUF3113 family protein, partial [Staphylococcus aureus]|nr:DUF3113 family protein [Staphylococcus aureus]